MTRKDYQALAARLSAKFPRATLVPDDLPRVRQGYVTAIEAVADALAADNPRFDRAKFLDAAGVNA